jgi:hypothetical protein
MEKLARLRAAWRSVLAHCCEFRGGDGLELVLEAGGGQSRPAGSSHSRWPHFTCIPRPLPPPLRHWKGVSRAGTRGAGVWGAGSQAAGTVGQDGQGEGPRQAAEKASRRYSLPDVKRMGALGSVASAFSPSRLGYT